MKTLIIYDSEGKVVFTQSNAVSTYRLISEEVPDNKEIAGVDIKSDKLILLDRLATTEDKERLKAELEYKNKELQVTKQELLQTQAELVDAVCNNLLK